MPRFAHLCLVRLLCCSEGPPLCGFYCATALFQLGLLQRMIGGLLQAFLSVRLVSISLLPDPGHGWLPFVLVLVPEVVLQSYYGSIFGALASPRALGELLRLGCRSGVSSGGCPGFLSLIAVQRVMAVCDRWVWFSCIGGPSLGLLGWFSL